MNDQFPEYTEKAGTCKECGNSPTIHILTKALSNLDIVTGTCSKYLENKFRSRKKRKPPQYRESRIAQICFAGLRLCGVIRYAHDPLQARSYRSRVIWEEAIRRGIHMEQAKIFDMFSELYRAKIEGEWVYFESLPIPPAYSRTSTAWIGDKVLLKRELRRHAIPVPRFESIRNFSQAEKFLKELGTAAVLKPRVGTRGRHTSVGIRTPDELKNALKSAKALCSFVSMEEELQGSVCRGTVVRGELVGFFQADPAIVVGDGKATIKELIERSNQSREKNVAEIEITDESLEYLRRLNYTLESVPPDGVKIRIGHRTGRLFGGKTRELLDTVHPRLKGYLEKAATVLDIAVVGFDLIIEDPERDPDTQRWGIIEANTLPFIDLHYLPLHGRPSNPAAAIWDLWDVQ